MIRIEKLLRFVALAGEFEFWSVGYQNCVLIISSIFIVVSLLFSICQENERAFSLSRKFIDFPTKVFEEEQTKKSPNPKLQSVAMGLMPTGNGRLLTAQSFFVIMIEDVFQVSDYLRHWVFRN